MEPMRTVKEMHADCSAAGQPNSYWGDRGDWLVVAGQHKDSDIVERSNFRSMLRKLGGENEDAGVAIEREAHWAVGLVEYLLVKPGTPAAELAAKMRDAIEHYPILDEDDYSELETEECEAVWGDCYSWRDRLEYLRTHSHTGDFRLLIAAVRGDWCAAANVLHCPSDLIR